jgi:hypothetical protein
MSDSTTPVTARATYDARQRTNAEAAKVAFDAKVQARTDSIVQTIEHNSPSSTQMTQRVDSFEMANAVSAELKKRGWNASQTALDQRELHDWVDGINQTWTSNGSPAVSIRW